MALLLHAVVRGYIKHQMTLSRGVNHSLFDRTSKKDCFQTGSMMVLFLILAQVSVVFVIGMMK
jgi:hypothetical protein